jgi:Flp pilus assembly protein TadG
MNLERLLHSSRVLVRSSDVGAELIEMALALPILLLVVAGIMDFGFLFQRYEIVTNAAREGARTAAKDSTGCANVSSVVNDYLTASGLTDTPNVSCGTTTDGPLASGLTVQVATVTVSYPSRFLFLGPIASLVRGSPPSSLQLTASSTMRLSASGS